MASSQPKPEQQPKVYLRNAAFNTNGADDTHPPSYGQTPVTYRTGDTTVYIRQPAAVQRAPYPVADTGGMQFYADELTTGTGTHNEISNEMKSRHPRPSQRPRHHHHHQNQRRERIEEPDGYWILPHASKHAKTHSTTAGAYKTPGGRLLSRTPKKHTAGLQVSGTEQTQLGGEQDDLTPDLTQDLEEYTQVSQYLPSEDSELTITFHYNLTGDLEAAIDNDLLVRLQAQCRAYLAKLDKRRRLKEDNAVRTIQKNAGLYFDPWFRLFLVLKPHLKRFRLEDEIIQLKSELEKFKAMVKVLRYENVAYQDKISRLLMLLDQMQPGGTSRDLVNKLVKELSLAVADHQTQWRAMISGIGANGLNGFGTRISPVVKGNLDMNDPDPTNESSYQLAKEKAEFYREQLELLREEVDDQNARTSQHYEEKIGVLSERVEQLQNMLTQESFRVERLNGELEAANSQLAEAREAEDTLTGMVDNLKAELARCRLPSAGDPDTPGEPMIVAKSTDNAFAAAPLPTSIEGLNEKLPDQISAQKKLMAIRNYLTENPDVYEALKDTPLGQGGEYDILSGTDRLGSTSYGLDGTLGHSMNSVFHSQSHIENYHLGRAHEVENRNDILQQKLEEEIDYREDLELEAQELRNKIANLQRQVRRQRDEHEEELVERDQAHIRRVRELNDTIEELSREKQGLEKRCLELQRKVEELREAPDLSDSEHVAYNHRDAHAMLVADNRQYLKELDQIREEFDQYKRENNTAELKEQLAERDERISQLEVSQRHTSSEMEILNVRLQSANRLLDDNEQKLRGLMKERQTLLHRISHLESERDSAVRETASTVGKAKAEREASAARQHELEDLKRERQAYQKELTDMKVTLTETSTKAQTEKQALEKRLSDLEAAATKREADLKGDLDTYKEKVDTLQQELSQLQKVESATSTDNRHLKRQIHDLQDSVENYTRKVAELERRNSDLSAELDRAKSNLSASRETATLLRDRQTRANEEYAASVGGYMDDVAYSDDEEALDGDTTASMFDIFRRSSGSYAGFSGTQTVDRHRNRSKQRQSARSASRSGLYKRSQPKIGLSSTLPRFGSHQFLPPSTTSKDASPQPPVSKPKAGDQQLELSYDSEF